MKILFICANQINNLLLLLAILLSILPGTRTYCQVKLELKPLEPTRYELIVNFDIEACDGIYEQYLSFSIDDPAITISPIICSIEPIIQYARAFKSSKSLFLGPCSFKGIIHAPLPRNLATAQLYITYRLLRDNYSKTIALSLLSSEQNQVSLYPVDPSIHRVMPSSLKTLGSENCRDSIKLQAEIHKNMQTLIDIPAAPFQPAFSSFLLAFLSFLCLAIGSFLLFKGSYAKRGSLWPLATPWGMALIACAMVITAKAYQAQYQASHSPRTTKISFK